ncbi:Protein Wnt [Sergentomyia squamirostris]
MVRVELIVVLAILIVFPPVNTLQARLQVIKKLSTESKFKNSINRFNPLASVVTQSEKLALRNCQQVFKWDRWNCPSQDFFIKRSSNFIDKEGAFVKAITVAAMLYSTIKNCTLNIMQCECKFNDPLEDESEIMRCVDHISALEEFLVDGGNVENRDIQGYSEVHNAQAGRIAVQRALKHHCRCSGYSSSCSLHTCWLQISDFPEIASDIRKMYDHSVRISLDNTGRVKRGISAESLVFLDDSPNYCLENTLAGWPGMKGRQCSRKRKSTTLDEKRSCRRLCRACGFKVKREQVIREKPCKCRFYWCCDVHCDTCSELINEHYCV